MIWILCSSADETPRRRIAEQKAYVAWEVDTQSPFKQDTELYIYVSGRKHVKMDANSSEVRAS